MFGLSKWRVCAISTILVVSACSPTSIYHRSGSEVSRIESDLVACRVTALEEVPVRERQRYVPAKYTRSPLFFPGGLYHGALYPPFQSGYFVTYDANEGLRKDATRSCMAEKGFSVVALPQCSPEVIQATTITKTRVQPPITENSCLIRIRSGGYQIVNP